MSRSKLVTHDPFAANKASGSFGTCFIVLALERAHTLLAGFLSPGGGVGHFHSKSVVFFSELTRQTRGALLERPAFALPHRVPGLGSLHFPRTQIFWLIVGPVMPELLANKSI